MSKEVKRYDHAALPQQHEAHRKTWGQNEQAQREKATLTGLLLETLPILSKGHEHAFSSSLQDLVGRIEAALSQQDGNEVDTSEQQPDPSELIAALQQIERWDGFPVTGKTWPESGEPMSYRACFGSNGERNFMRLLAAKAVERYRAAVSATPKYLSHG